MLSECATSSNLYTRDHSQCENFNNTPTVVDTMEPIVFSRAIGLCGIGTFCPKVTACLCKSFSLLTNYCFALLPCIGLDTTIRQASQKTSEPVNSMARKPLASLQVERPGGCYCLVTPL